MKVTLLCSCSEGMYEASVVIHGVYASRERALKVLRYIFERKYRHESKRRNSVFANSVYYRNSQRDEFETMDDVYWVETQEVKK